MSSVASMDSRVGCMSVDALRAAHQLKRIVRFCIYQNNLIQICHLCLIRPDVNNRGTLDNMPLGCTKLGIATAVGNSVAVTDVLQWALLQHLTPDVVST